ncbi:MAG: tRNA adenosine(34) deaminase TadA [Gammaproteobacteria bacterium]
MSAEVSSFDREYMARALALAARAAEEGEVPVGALLVHDGQVIAEGWNRPIAAHDPTAHAEIQVLRRAGRALSNYRLNGSVMYVTLEPCPMCVGAMIHARIGRLVYAAHDPKTGALGGAFDLAAEPSHNHRIAVSGGVLMEEAAQQLRDFFRARRKKGRDAEQARDRAGAWPLKPA